MPNPLELPILWLQMVTHMLPLLMITIEEYLDQRGRSPFARWFEGLPAPAAAKVTVALIRMEHGNFSNAKGVGVGVLECRIDFGPGYRIYFGKVGETVIVLLGGGSKKHQSGDIRNAQERWRDYRWRKAKET